jgi:predicted  nucleic acid-binding Zn-ribbon protein
MATKQQTRREIEAAVRARMIQVREEYQRATKDMSEAQRRFDVARDKLAATYKQANKLSEAVAEARAELEAAEVRCADAHAAWEK